MFSIDVMLKHLSLPLSVQRKTEEEARKLYEEALAALETGSPKILKLTCDRDEGKQIAVLSSEIAVVQISEKSSGMAAGRVPGFAAISDG